MIMGRRLNEVIAGLPEARRRKVAARAAAIIAEEMTLKDLRKVMRRTQASMAKKLGIGQDGVSRLEQRTDMLLSTLNAHIEALGGTLHIIAELPDRAPVRLKELGAIATKRTARKLRRPPAAAVRHRSISRKA
jgi:transcriptional regulator with XRE-family HTH domain